MSRVPGGSRVEALNGEAKHPPSVMEAEDISSALPPHHSSAHLLERQRVQPVREWEATRDRKQREPVFRKTVATDRGTLTFTSITELDPERQQRLLSETHTLVNDAGEHSSDYRFVMRCRTRTELERNATSQLTAPLSERVTLQLRDGRKTDNRGAITRAAASRHVQGPATVRTRCAARDVAGRSPPWTTHGRLAGA